MAKNQNKDRFERNTAQEEVQFEIRPDFLEEVDERKPRTERKTGTGDAQDTLNDAEAGAENGGYYRGGTNASAQETEEKAPARYYTGAGKEIKKKVKKFGIGKASAAITILFLIVLIIAVVAFIGRPIYQLGALDFGLMRATGITNAANTLREQSIRVGAELAKSGKMPDKLAGDMAANGIMVGQVTANGDFVRTNEYIANIEDLKDLAVLGNYQVRPSEGELAVLFNNEVITADNFVAAVLDNPELYAEFDAAVTVPAKFYLDKANSVIENDFGLDRSFTREWKDTGDPEENAESYWELLSNMLDSGSALTVSGYDRDQTTITKVDADGNETTTDIDRSFTEALSGGSSMGMIQSVSSQVTGKNATERGAELFNFSISAAELYSSMRYFMGIEVPAQQARAGENGPVNEEMNLLYREEPVTVMDVSKRQLVEKVAGVLTTPNFAAAVSGGKLSKEDGLNMSRDRGGVLTGGIDEILGDTTVSSSGYKTSDSILSIGEGDSADIGVLSILDNSVDLSMVENNSDLYTTAVGGERAFEGGLGFSTMLNQMKLGGMGSDAKAAMAYHKETQVYAARKEAAERATRSPFDISSPYTFMGSLVRGMSNAMIRSKVSSDGVAGTTIGVIAELTNDSSKELWGNVMADGEDDELVFGEGCETVNSIDIEGDLYCTMESTLSTGYMDNTQDEWQNGTLAGNFDDNGQIIKNSELDKFINIGMDRMSTVGIKDADVCEKWQNSMTGLAGLFARFKNWLLRELGVFYNACDGTDSDVATSKYWTFSDSNPNSENSKKYGGYVLYDMVRSIMTEETSKVALAQERYLAEHPRDNSEAGRLARITGLTKDEAQIALAYGDYLTMIAQYNPATRYAFGGPLIELEQTREPIVEHANRVAVELYVMWHGRTEYDDLRGRIQVV